MAAERTPQDYAIEHAGYMATAARDMIEAVEALATAELHREESDSDQSHDAVAEAREGVAEAGSTLRNRIYEFEKRRDRAAGIPVVVAANPSMDQGPCTVCGKLWRDHGTYPVYESHNYTPASGVGGTDGR